MFVKTEKICQAVSALKQLTTKENESKKAHKLLDESQSGDLLLHISVNKIPVLEHLQCHKIKLPHRVMTDLKDVCLLTSNLNKRHPDDDQTIRHYSQVLSSRGISVGQIIPYHQLRTEYKTFEARRHLARAYSVFLNEGNISKMMPVALGAFFIRKKKMPISISLKKEKVKAEFARVMSKTTLTLTGRGSSCGVKVGLLSQDDRALVENIEAVVEYLGNHLPGKWANVHALHLKTQFSIALPIYISTDSPNDVEMPSGPIPAGPIEGELDTLTRSRVRVYPSGRVKLVKVQADEIDNEIVDNEKRILSHQRLHKSKAKRLRQKLHAKTLMRKEAKAKQKVKDLKKKKQTDEKKKTKKVETAVITSAFGFSSIGESKVDGSKKQKKKKISKEEMSVMITPDKSFQDSFSVQGRKKRPVLSRSEKTDTKSETSELKTPEIVQKKRLPRLLSIRKSYDLKEKRESSVPNGSTELVYFRKQDFVDSGETSTEACGKKRKVKGKRNIIGTNENKDPLHSIKETEKDGPRKKLKSSENEEIRTTKKGIRNVEKKVGENKRKEKLSRLQSIRQSVRLAKGLM